MSECFDYGTGVEAEVLHLLDVQAVVAEVEEGWGRTAFATSFAGVEAHQAVLVHVAGSCGSLDSFGAVLGDEELADFERYGGYALLEVCFAGCSVGWEAWEIVPPAVVVCAYDPEGLGYADRQRGGCVASQDFAMHDLVVEDGAALIAVFALYDPRRVLEGPYAAAAAAAYTAEFGVVLLNFHILC